MLKIIKVDPDDFDDYEEVALSEQDKIVATKELANSSYTGNLKYSIATTFKNGIITSSGIVGGCYCVITLAPKVVQLALTYAIPTAAVGGVLANTVSASLSVGTYAVGRKVAMDGVEASLDLSAAGVFYMYRSLYTVDAKEESRKQILLEPIRNAPW